MHFLQQKSTSFEVLLKLADLTQREWKVTFDVRACQWVPLTLSPGISLPTILLRGHILLSAFFQGINYLIPFIRLKFIRECCYTSSPHQLLPLTFDQTIFLLPCLVLSCYSFLNVWFKKLVILLKCNFHLR